MICKLELADISQVVKIHRQELSGFLSELGEEFLKKFYKASLNIPEIFTFVEKKNEQVLGFVSGVTSPKGLYKKIFFKDIFPFTQMILGIFITHPLKIVKMAKILTYPGFSSGSPELITIAVEKKHQRRGIGKKLFLKTAQEFEKRKIKKFHIGVYSRLPANAFYRKTGCRFCYTFNFLGEKMNYYAYGREDFEKLRLILLTYDSLYGNPIFLPLFDKPFIEIAAVVVSDCILHKRSHLASLLFLFKRNGWQYFIFKVLDQFFYVLTDLKRYLWNWRYLSNWTDLNRKTRLLWEVRKRNIPVFKIKDINSEKPREILEKYEPDFMISYFNQVLKKETLVLPRLGCLNVHPGYLPDYRGVASSFWAMLKGENFGGVTIHFMMEKLDSGDIIEREKVPVTQKESLHRHNYLCCKLGGELLLKALYNIYKKKEKRIKQEKGNYYSWPKKEDVDEFLKKGYRLFSIKDLGLY